MDHVLTRKREAYKMAIDTRCTYIGNPYHQGPEAYSPKMRCILKSGHKGEHFFYCPNRSVPYIFREDRFKSGVEVYATDILDLLDESVKEFVL